MALKTIGIAIFSISMLISFGLTSNQAFAGGFTDCAQCESFRTQCLAGNNPNTVECNSIADQCLEDLMCSPVVGGEIIPIEATSLILTGAQTFSWMLPVVLSVLGIGLFAVSRKSEIS
jgi:hypothetical protein